MSSIYDEIDELTDDQVLEAVNLLSGEILGLKTNLEIQSEISSITHVSDGDLNNLLASATPREVVSLGRATLTAAAAAGREDEVHDAIDAVGQKALLIEITVIGLLALSVIYILRTGGKKDEVHETETIVAPDGKITVKSKDTTHYYPLGESLGPLAASLLKGVLPK